MHSSASLLPPYSSSDVFSKVITQIHPNFLGLVYHYIQYIQWLEELAYISVRKIFFFCSGNCLFIMTAGLIAMIPALMTDIGNRGTTFDGLINFRVTEMSNVTRSGWVFTCQFWLENFLFSCFLLSGIALTTKPKPDLRKNLSYFEHINNS